MSLVDMAFTKAELKEHKKGYMTGGEPEAFPWGLCIRLEKPELEKLGMGTKVLPGVGDEFHIMVVAKVTSVNQQLRENDDDSTSIALQITQMEVQPKAQAAAEPAKPAAKAAAPAGKATVMSTYLAGAK